jgi:hypothetical protein
MNLATIIWRQNLFNTIALHGGEMIKEIEKEIGDLTEELAEVQKNQALLCLKSCRADSDF